MPEQCSRTLRRLQFVPTPESLLTSRIHPTVPRTYSHRPTRPNRDDPPALKSCAPRQCLRSAAAPGGRAVGMQAPLPSNPQPASGSPQLSLAPPDSAAWEHLGLRPLASSPLRSRESARHRRVRQEPSHRDNSARPHQTLTACVEPGRLRMSSSRSKILLDSSRICPNLSCATSRSRFAM